VSWSTSQPENPPWQNRNQCNLHHQPHNFVITIPDMPLPCIGNAKYENSNQFDAEQDKLE
jgi:hypothetical protein